MQDMSESGLSQFNRVFDPQKASSKVKNQEMARRLHNAILSGNITDPEVISELTNYYRNAIFDEKTVTGVNESGRISNFLKMRIPKTPDYMSFDVSAEIPAMRGFDAPLLLSGRGRSRNNRPENRFFNIVGSIDINKCNRTSNGKSS